MYHDVRDAINNLKIAECTGNVDFIYKMLKHLEDVKAKYEKLDYVLV